MTAGLPRGDPAIHPVIGFDGSRLSVGERTGTETYTAQILRHLVPLLDHETLRVYLRASRIPSDLPSIPSVHPIAIPFPRAWTHARLSWEMRRHPPDLLFIPAHVVPLYHPPTVVTIHDLGYLHHPDGHPPAQRHFLGLTTRWSAMTAAHIIAISHATKRDLVGAYGVPPSKITVIHHGVDPSFHPQPATSRETFERRLGLPDHFVLTVGTIQPRKNLSRLVAAMHSVAAAGLPHKLVIAGKRGWLADQVEHHIAAKGLPDRIVRLGYVPTADLPALYAAADAFALPSLYEGFGLPALEALASGVPTLVSDRSSLPEVVGDAALFVNPLDTDAIGAALVQLLRDDALRARLRDLGPKHASSFTWDRSARETLTVLRAVLSGSAPAR